MRERTTTHDAVHTLFGGRALVELEIFTPTGVLAGSTADVPLVHDGPDLAQPLLLEDARWFPIDGGPPSQRGDLSVDPDDILLIVTPEPELKVHMGWYPVVLEVGPYYVSARMATHPGFDPEKALARPGGVFVALTDASIALVDADDGNAAERPYIHVNRYAVDKVTSSLMLGHFFPGARLETKDSVPVA